LNKKESRANIGTGHVVPLGGRGDRVSSRSKEKTAKLEGKKRVERTGRGKKEGQGGLGNPGENVTLKGVGGNVGV